MSYLYLDPFSGLSGNMLLGLLFDLGLNYEQFQTELKKLHVTGYHLTLEKTNRSAIGGHLFNVVLAEAHHQADEGLTASEAASHAHSEQSKPHHHHHHGRNLLEIKALITDSDLKQSVKDQAIAVFTEIAQAEAHVHQLSTEAVHFHEVGAIDSIVDIVGFFVGLDLMGIKGIQCGVLVDGSGTIQVAHGTMPVPVPAVMQMRQNSEVPVKQRTDIQTELVTPTGFAIAKLTVDSFGPIPDTMQIQRVGYGFGTRDTGHLNALRGLLLTPMASHKEVHSTSDEIYEIHANVDDQTGEDLGFALSKLIHGGALDAYFTPIFMKKNRPAYELTVIAAANQLSSMIALLLQQTTTFGVRWTKMKRQTLPRKFETVTTQWGEVTVKIGVSETGSKITVEHDTAAALADAHQISLDQVRQAALFAYKKEDRMV
ncbi:nickel pincer cofactor biosynthesis protein LarC [uncultured Secundilactobacillus sp.]|uniref:nickel pincer cofactor biosynthesis protein LarC n=1 Tax=uncultured Secundilactobacillus sp. TaxID=2813935 RepID=UPI00258EAA68|nr:nickel pincer cofactor biosynthesis protein LarC [uncultured Secundilactobacillus sp.]